MEIIKNVKRKSKTGSPVQGPILIQHPLIEIERLCQFVNAEVLSGTFTESVSVSLIINMYFSGYDEVASSPVFPFSTTHKERLKSSVFESKNSNIESRKLSYEASREKSRKPEVGKRLLLASDGLGLTPSNRGSTLSPSRCSNGKSPFCQSSTDVVRNLVFEIAEEGA